MLPDPTARLHMLAVANQVMQLRAPDFIVGGADNPYLLRWYLTPRDDGAGIYLHRFLRSDDDRALHDHPWDSTTWILQGGYVEHLPGGTWVCRAQGWVGSRMATDPHRVELHTDAQGQPLPAVTLFTHGPKLRDWGFLCPQGWRPWQEFVDARDHGAVGRGCE